MSHADGEGRPGVVDRVQRFLGGPLRRTVLLVLLLFVVGVVAVNVSRSSDEGGGVTARRDVPPPPDAMPSPGTWVDSTVRADGKVTVQQWIRSPAPVSRLQLTTADPDAFPGTVESSRVIISGFDGARLAVRDTIGTRTLNVRLRQPATDMYLTYTITGDTLSSEASTVAGRSVARVTAMDVVLEGEQGATVRVLHGPGTVLTAGCLDPAEGYESPPRACGGATDDGGWRIELRGANRHDRVLAQLAD